MELKDVILSTLAEMEDVAPAKNNQSESNTNDDGTVHIRRIPQEDIKTILKKPETIDQETAAEYNDELNEDASSSEIIFLQSVRERLLVLFEGFQAPNNTNIEAKVDMTLNFLEYVLVTIDERIQKIEKGYK